jgi:hypothetical protein
MACDFRPWLADQSVDEGGTMFDPKNAVATAIGSADSIG